MLHPSYTEMLKKVNEPEYRGEDMPEIDSRYSIVIATAKRARELIAGADSNVPYTKGEKPLSVAVKELYDGQIKIKEFGVDTDFEDELVDLVEEELVEAQPEEDTEE